MDLSIKIEDSRLYIRTAIVVRVGEDYIFEKSPKGYMFLVGGKLKINELSYDGAKRELMEEIGLDTDDLSLLKVLEHIFHNGEENIHEICFVYICNEDFKGGMPDTGFAKIKREDLSSSDIRPEIIKNLLVNSN